MRSPGAPLNQSNLPIQQSNLTQIAVPGFRTVASSTYPGGYRVPSQIVYVEKATYTHAEVGQRKLRTQYMP